MQDKGDIHPKSTLSGRMSRLHDTPGINNPVDQTKRKNMNSEAHKAIEDAWDALVRVRAVCPSATEAALGTEIYQSPPFYREHGVNFIVKSDGPLTREGLAVLREMTAFVNRSFVIVMAAILEAHDLAVGDYKPKGVGDGRDHALLVKWLRNRFAHGEFMYDPNEQKHIEARRLLEDLIPKTKEAAYQGLFPAAIDVVLEPLKDGVLRYIAAS